MLVRLNQQLQREIRYLVRMEPGIQTPDETLEQACGSCRDTGWLLVQILRHLGLAARFASGYLIQLVADVKSLDGPAGPERDFTDLHAWAEVYLPGAGWVGFDPTSGLLAGEGHIPLACTADPGNAAPVIGFTDPCNVEFSFAMSVTRVHEDPRVTKPYSEAQWEAIESLGRRVDRDLAKHDVRLTQGGEPTFVSIDDMEGPEWNYAASSPKKRELAETLLRRLADSFASGGFLHIGQGKWYPGEPLPRWALGVYWRTDGKPLWRDRTLIADTRARRAQPTSRLAQRFAATLATNLGLDAARLSLPRTRTFRSSSPPNRRSRTTSTRSRPILPSRPSARDWRGFCSAAPNNPQDSYCRYARWQRRTRRDPNGADEPVAAAPRAALRSGRRFAARSAPAAGVLARCSSGGHGSGSGGGPLRSAWRAAGRGRAGRVGQAPCERAEGRAQGCDQDGAVRRGARRSCSSVHAAARPPRGLRRAARRSGSCRRSGANAGRDRRLHAAARSARQGAERDARSRRHRGEHPSGGIVGRDHCDDRDAVRGCSAMPPRHRKVHARRPAHGHRRRQPRHPGRRDARGQPAPAPSRSVAKPRHVLAEPPGAVVPVLGHLHRADEPGAARRRGARRRLYELEIAFQQLSRAHEAGSKSGKPWLVDRLLRHLLDRPHRQHAPRRVLDRQAVFARRPDRPPRACSNSAPSKCRRTRR